MASPFLSCRLPLLAVVLALSGCAAQTAYREGESLAASDQIEAALLKYQQAIAADPNNPRYRTAWLNLRDRNASRMLTQGDLALAEGNAALALQYYQRAQAIDPANERARAGLRTIEADGRHARLLKDAVAAVERKEYDTARAALTAILTERPQHEAARLLLADVTEKTAAPLTETALAAAFRQPISIEFRDTSIKQILEVISRRSGLNFLFDKDVKSDTKTAIFLKNSTVEQALYFVLMTNQLEQQVMDNNTILIYPNSPAKRLEYQEFFVKTYFLANADAKIVANTLKGILKTRDVVVDEKLNLIIVRDNAEGIKLATKLIAVQDVAEPEVMLEVEILEIKRSRVMDLGIAWPASLGLTPLASFGGGAITLDNLRDLSSKDIGVSGITATLNANRKDGDSNTLANPRIRVRNKEKAKIVIGDKVPSITTTLSPGGGVGAGFSQESINYLDVGLTLNVEPTIYLNNEIAIRVGLTVSNLVGTIKTQSGNTAYQIGTREATTMLQLKDGENQVLAGLINSEDRSSGNRIPGIGSLPIVGRLFGTAHDENDKTEIVLSITPRLIRNIQRPAASASEFSTGSDNHFRRRPDPVTRAPVVMPASPALRAPDAPPAAMPPPVPSSQPVPSTQPPAALPSTLPPSVLPAPLAAPAAVPVQEPVGAGIRVTPIPAPVTTPAPQR